MCVCVCARARVDVDTCLSVCMYVYTYVCIEKMLLIPDEYASDTTSLRRGGTGMQPTNTLQTGSDSNSLRGGRDW